MVASTQVAGPAPAVAAEFAFEVVHLAVVQFPQVALALPGIRGSVPRRFSLGFAGQAACILATN